MMIIIITITAMMLYQNKNKKSNNGDISMNNFRMTHIDIAIKITTLNNESDDDGYVMI